MSQTSLNYRYAGVSQLARTDNAESLFLSKFSEDTKGMAPCLFWGQLRDPFIISRCLINLSQIVKSNFAFRPSQLASLKDPIVTAGNEQIRFEAFSTCAGVYARLDILPDGQDGEFIENGTTNVDFNLPLITELNRIHRNDRLVLSIGKKEVGFHRDRESIIERKVPLPSKWIKGLTTVQHFFSESESATKINRLQAMQLFRTIPAGTTKHDLFLAKRGSRYLFSPVQSKSAICIGGAHRLHLLNPLIPLSKGLTIYRHPSDQSISITLHFERANYVFAVSRSASRGFSGEGAGLDELLEDTSDDLIAAFDNYTYTNQSFNPADIALEHDLDFSKIESLSTKLAAMGLLGFDLECNSFFYRRLPFKLSRILSLNPRLKGALQLIENQKVRLQLLTEDHIKANVEGSSGEQYYVLITEDQAKCTCPWYTKNQGERGPCKHILATKKMAKTND